MMSGDGSDDEQAIVIDNGTTIFKGGFAGDDAPRAVFRSMVGRPRYRGIMVGIIQKDAYIGDEAHSKRGILSLKYPIEHGIITNWDDMEQIWYHTFYNELIIQPDNHSVLSTESALNPNANREKTIEIMFETFNVPAFYLATQSVLALYANGKQTGICVHCGDSGCRIVPVYNQRVIRDAINTLNIAGRALTEHLMYLMTQSGFSFTGSSEREILKDIKEKICYVSQDFDADLNLSEERVAQKYELPDGQTITLHSERFKVSEPLFKPKLIRWSSEDKGIHELIHKCVLQCDENVRNELLNNVVCEGGTSMFSGFEDRLKKEMQTAMYGKNLVDGYLKEYYRKYKSVDALYKDIVDLIYRYDGVDNDEIVYDKLYKLNVIAPVERKYSAWIGGSIMASMDSFNEEWIMRHEYDEMGASVVHKKCPLN